MGLFDFLRPKIECPLSAVDHQWIDYRWKWLEDEFGLDRVRSVQVVLPRAKFFPDPYHRTDACVRRMVERVCGYMGIDPSTIDVMLYEDSRSAYVAGGSGTAGLYQEEQGRFKVWIEVKNLADPLALVGTIAHELGHVLLLGHRRLSGREDDHEPLTDLITVFLGLGVFTANSVIREKTWTEGNRSGWSISRQGYLTMNHFGYAFAKFAASRGEDGSAWSRELRLDVRSAFKASRRYLAAGDDRLVEPKAASAGN